MGTGKTSVKRYLETTNHVVDLDEQLVHVAGMGIPTYFQRFGEAAFRELESVILKSTKAEYVVTGGGIVERAENVEWMKANGTVVALDAPFELCWARIRHSNRPLVKGGEARVRALYDRRLPLYREADVVLDASRGTEDVVRQLKQLKEEKE
ncbi:shikimate kinase [Exiguobacterium himgiriensis]|nr:shikimate kinase [Exiguobacterium sp. s122]MCT4784312.1 shikimate kinase [Exiguobacterium himgiriensis]